MRAVVQRVTQARVSVEGRVVGDIGNGVLALVGTATDDAPAEATWMADKVANLRIFSDGEGKMNRSLLDMGGEALVVSQFTLYGDARKGRRPSFIRAAEGPDAEAVYQEMIRSLERLGIVTESGLFGAVMQVELTNDGPVTILLDSEKKF